MIKRRIILLVLFTALAHFMSSNFLISRNLELVEELELNEVIVAHKFFLSKGIFFVLSDDVVYSFDGKGKRVGIMASAFPATATAPHRNYIKFGVNDCGSNGRTDFDGFSLTDTDKTIHVADGHGCAEPRFFTCISLFLDEINS